MIPLLTANGVLPEGVHDSTLQEIKTRFGAFQGSDRRTRLFANLESFVSEARKAGFVRALVIDGSFVSASENPNDIDLVVVLAREHDFAADLAPLQYNLVSKIRVQRRFGFDIVAAREGTVEYEQAVEFYAQVRHAVSFKKGMLRLIL